MELWEYNCCIRIAQQQREAEAKETLTHAWLVANFANMALSGKLKALKEYVEEPKHAENISKADFESLLEQVERNDTNGIT